MGEDKEEEDMELEEVGPKKRKTSASACKTRAPRGSSKPSAKSSVGPLSNAEGDDDDEEEEDMELEEVVPKKRKTSASARKTKATRGCSKPSAKSSVGPLRKTRSRGKSRR